MTIPTRHSITVTALGEYIRHHSCDRRFYLTAHHADAQALPFFDRLGSTLEPVLARVGTDREEQWEKELRQAGFADLVEVYKLPKGEKRKDVAWADLAGVLAGLRPGESGYVRQVRVQADLGAFALSGLIDFVLVRWDGGRPKLWLVECKASRRDRTYHRVQVAVSACSRHEGCRLPTLAIAGGIPSHSGGLPQRLPEPHRRDRRRPGAWIRQRPEGRRACLIDGADGLPAVVVHGGAGTVAQRELVRARVGHVHHVAGGGGRQREAVAHFGVVDATFVVDEVLAETVRQWRVPRLRVGHDGVLGVAGRGRRRCRGLTMLAFFPFSSAGEFQHAISDQP